LIQLLFRLVRRPHSRQELAREYGVSAKTISRDIDALSLEYPIAAKREGREVFYQFADGFKFEFPKISIEELATLLLAQESIAGIGITAEGSPYAGYADSLLEKIRKSLPNSVRERMDALANVYGSSAIPAKNFARHTDTIDRLASCAVRQKKVSVHYHSLGSDKEQTRILEPYAVYFDPDGATLKLVAFDPNYNQLRVFSIERITNVQELSETFKRPKEFILQDYLDENCFNGIHGKPVSVRLKATGITARIFNERKFHPTQKTIEKKHRRGTSPETITIEMRVANGRGLIRFIMSWLPDVEIISPEEVRDEVRRILLKGLENL
ncbi:MAG: WYL domain-containing protein, partial [Acidobacteriota bacterium]|nr:WYL domain-containing protein [Acidobacteriota bacterium]